MNVLGLISGSSLDGLDICLCEFNGLTPGDIKWNIHFSETVTFPEELRGKLNNVASVPAFELYQTEVQFSRFCAEQINRLKKKLRIQIDYVASHGHTVFHYPEDGFTLQIGNGAILAEETGISTIVDFRSSDIALGGQGAPVAPIVEQWLFPGYNYYLNLGGIANLAVHTKDGIYSFDSCPCNQVLNHLASSMGMEYDEGGRLASAGRVNEELLSAWSSIDYFVQTYPKSMDNTWVREVYIPVMDQFQIPTKDKLATMVSFVVTQLSNDLKPFVNHQEKNSRIMATGGGARNDYLIRQLSEKLGISDISVEVPNPQVVDFKEAALIALMGYLRVNEIANTIPSVTGANRPTSGGAIYYPLA